MKIMSWNVNQFCGMGSWDENDWNYVKPADRIPYMNYVILYVKEFLSTHKDNIVILQEVPGANVPQSLYRTFKAAFFEENYKFFTPENTNAFEITIAISNEKSNWVEPKTRFVSNGFKNRYIEISYIQNDKEMWRILGVHMPITSDKIVEYFWNALINYSKQPKERNLIIVGDFNAYINAPGYGDKYAALLSNGYMCNLPNKENTYRKAPRQDDHMLIPKNKFEMEGKVLKDITLSDHYPIVAEIPDGFFSKDEYNCQHT